MTLAGFTLSATSTMFGTDAPAPVVAAAGLAAAATGLGTVAAGLADATAEVGATATGLTVVVAEVGAAATGLAAVVTPVGAAATGLAVDGADAAGVEAA